jgi:hypothetical protein
MAGGLPAALEWRTGEPRSWAGDGLKAERGFLRVLAAAHKKNAIGEAFFALANQATQIKAGTPGCYQHPGASLTASGRRLRSQNLCCRFGARIQFVAGHRRMIPMADQNEFRPGQMVPTSGIYSVTHDNSHVLSHDVTCVAGKPFPPCNGCGEHPRFKLKYAAHHIDDHPQFGQEQAARRYRSKP